MTDELKCLAHPCDGVMEANLYDASLTCSKCQFQVADESEYSALVAGRQAAIDATLIDLTHDLGSLYIHRNGHELYNSAIDDVARFIKGQLGTNPLAERAAEYARGIEFRVGQLAERDARIAELERELSEQADTIVDGLAKRRELERERDRAIQHHERCAEKLFKAERELAKQLERNKLLKHANSLFANSGDNDELAIDQLRRELAEARQDAERYEAKLFALGAMEEPPCFKCGYNGPGYFQTATHPCAHNHHNAMRQEGE